MQSYVTLKVCILVDYEDLFAQCSVGSHISRLNRPRTEQRGAGERASEGAKSERGGKWPPKKRTLLGNGEDPSRSSHQGFILPHWEDGMPERAFNNGW